MRPILTFRGVSVESSERLILNQVSASVHAGEFVSIVGRNGAGKTTLLKAALGLVPLSAGEVELHGRPLNHYSRRERAKLVAYVPQSLEAPFAGSVQEFVLLSRYPYLRAFRGFAHEDHASVSKALELARVDTLKNRSLRHLSGGERQRVLIAAALAQEAPLLLLDEPTHFLDGHAEAEVFSLLADLRRASRYTVVMVTHHVNRALLHSSRILALCEGAILFDGAPQEYSCDPALTDTVGKAIHLVSHPSSGQQVVVPALH